MQFKLIALAVALVAPATASILERATAQPCCLPQNYPCPYPTSLPPPPPLNGTDCCLPLRCVPGTTRDPSIGRCLKA
ncbi:hypothetical protein B0H14DRAFT_3444956 [Mycena olivaceomarginata]|nr:hypothetical protein B0H14DRAFT_3444956 [Mycena olivaceomarginata]